MNQASVQIKTQIKICQVYAIITPTFKCLHSDLSKIIICTTCFNPQLGPPKGKFFPQTRH